MADVEIRERARDSTGRNRYYSRVRVTVVYEIEPRRSWEWQEAAREFGRGVTAGGPRRDPRRDPKRSGGRARESFVRGSEIVSVRAAGVRPR